MKKQLSPLKSLAIIILVIPASLFSQLKIPLNGKAQIIDPFPNAIKVSPNGKIYIADRHNYKIKVFSEQGKYLYDLGARGEGPGQFKRWFGAFTIGQDGNVYQVDFWGGNRCITVFSNQGKFINTFRIKLNKNFGPESIYELSAQKFILSISHGNIFKQQADLVFAGSNLDIFLVDHNGKIIKTLIKSRVFFDFSDTEERGWPSIPIRVNLLSDYSTKRGIIAYQKSNENQVHLYHIKSGETVSIWNGFKKIALQKKDITDWIEKVISKRLRDRFFHLYKKIRRHGKTIEEFKPIVNRLMFNPEGDLFIGSLNKETQIFMVHKISKKKNIIKRFSSKIFPSVITNKKIYYIDYNEEKDLYYLVIRERGKDF